MGYNYGDGFPFDLLNQMEFHLVQKIEGKTVTTIIYHSILMKGNGNILFSVEAGGRGAESCLNLGLISSYSLKAPEPSQHFPIREFKMVRETLASRRPNAINFA